MKDSETFGIESGYGKKVVEWMNEQSEKSDKKFEARTYDYTIKTQNFGSFEMFSWMGDINLARNLIIKASKRFKIRIIEGGYKTKEKIFKMKKTDYAIVRKGDKILGHIEFSTSRFGSGNWQIKEEERR